MSNFQRIMLGLVGLLVVAVVVGIFVIVQQKADADAYQAFLDCMARYGVTPTDTSVPMDQVAEARELCDY